MKVLLMQLDGKMPNIALMRLSTHHRALGDEIEFRFGRNVEPQLWDDRPDRVYASLIFSRTKPDAERLLQLRPDAIIGGTGWDVTSSLEQYGITTDKQDYSIYPRFRQSLGFTQRGCRLKCSFCVVPKKEGAIKEVQTINEIWRGGEYPKEIILLDNDFFGQPHWQDRINEMREGGFKVSFNQGINARMLNDESAAAIASVDYRDDSMKSKRIYTAWDNQKDEKRLFAGLEALKRAGVKPEHVMVYMLCGYWPGETDADREYRRAKLREFGAMPYPMPFVRTPELIGFQRFVVGAYDKRVKWEDWKRANYDPHKLGNQEMRTQPVLF